VDFLQLGACAAGFVALEDFDVVFEIEFFEEPDDALGAGLLEPVFWLLVQNFLSSFPFANELV
jgi:hypothetical protein